MPLIPQVGVNLIDVKDVAEMHIEAMLHKNAAGKRFLLSSESFGRTFLQYFRIL